MLTGEEIRARLRGRVHAPMPPLEHRRAAVLVPLEPERGVWLTLRAGNLSNHAGQVAFPGGRIDPGDATPEAAALREAAEEIALDPGDTIVLGRLDDLITGTGFHVTPVVALVAPGLRFTPAADEVAAVFCLPYEMLLDPQAPRLRSAIIQGRERSFWVWPEAPHLVWGATARILVDLAQALRGPP